MEVLLKRGIETLGRIGDVVSVKPGYARNYLLPLGFAVPVTKANLEEIEKERARALAEEQSRISGLKDVAERLSATSVTIEGRANEEGHLFGSVNASQIATAIREKGFAVEEKSVRLEAPLKEIGVFDVTVHLHAGVDAVIKVWVVQAKPS
ncbi:MAG: 50S ribosomal protein L9 [Planctomycetota bacterium]